MVDPLLLLIGIFAAVAYYPAILIVGMFLRVHDWIADL